MIALSVFLICVLVVLFVGAKAAWSDLGSMKIPNSYTLIVIGAFFCAFCAHKLGDAQIFGTFLSHLSAGVFIFAVTFVMFLARVFGGGDAKIITGYAFWFGPDVPMFLLFVTLFGAVTGAIALILKKFKPIKSPKESSWVARCQNGESVIPYGVPIFLGVLLSFVFLGYLSPEVLKSFLEISK